MTDADKQTSKKCNPKPHPLAHPDPRGGAFDLRAGDRFIYDLDGRRGWADEFLHDGEAYVTFDDGTYATIKWNHMSPEPPPNAE